MNRRIEICGRRLGGAEPLICTPMTAGDLSGLLLECDEVKKKKPGIAEWRADYLTEGNVPYCEYTSRIKAGIEGIPLLFTLRAGYEGGQREMLEEARLAAILSVLEGKQVDLVDVELSAGQEFVTSTIAAAHANGVYTIVSYHNFNTTPDYEAIMSVLRDARDTGADIAKIAVTPHTPEHVLTLLTALNAFHKANEIPVIAISMGSLGVVSRIAGHIFGSAVTYASLMNASAPGQISITDMDAALAIIGTAREDTDD